MSAFAAHGIASDAFLMEVEFDVLVAASVGGLHGILAYLNARNRYRFTGVFPVGRTPGFSAYLYDREIPAVACADHRQLSQVCDMIARAEGIGDSDADVAEVADVAMEGGRSIAWIGAPLIGSDGVPCGLLCHFDPRLRTAPERETAVLRFLGARASRTKRAQALEL
jgi:hypothetical protein